MTYLVLKFLHVVFAMIWVGGVIALTAFSLLLLRTSDRAFLVSLTRYSAIVGARVTGPAAGLTILAGIGAAWYGHLGFPFWILWGIAAFLVIMVMGAVLFRRAGMEFGRLLAQPNADERAIVASQRRMAVQQLVMIALLLVTVGVMVFKPTF